MGNLTNKYIKDTYDGLIKLKDEYNGVKPELQPLQDGLGTDLPAQVSTTEFIITGSLVGNATSADTATSASHALEADNASTASYVLGSNVDGPVQDAVSSSYAVTASYSLNAGSDTYVTGATWNSGSGVITIKQTEGEPDVTVDIDGRYVTLTQGQAESLRLDFIEYATASLEAFTSSQEIINSEFVNDISGLSSQTGSYLVTGSVAGNVITLEKQDGSTFPLTVTVSPADLPAGLVSGSVQVILQDTTGNLSGSRISGPVLDSVNSVSSSHAIYAETAGTAITSQYSDNTVVQGKNLDASTITKGTPLYFTDSGTSGNLVGVYPADAGNPSRMPAGGIAGEDMLPGAEGVVLLDGFINGVSTTGFTAGDIVYVGVGGGYTNQRPTGSNGGGQPNKVQELGYIQKVDATNGSGVIKGPGISNDIPNILEGHFFVGNSDLVATPTSTGSFARRDEANTFTQQQIIDGAPLFVQGGGSLTVSDNQFPVTIQSGSQSISFVMNDFGATQPTILFNGDNAYFQANGNFNIENSPGGFGTGSMNFSTNGFLGMNSYGTGSEAVTLYAQSGPINLSASGNNINLNSPIVNAQDIFNAKRVRISGGAGTDLDITGSVLASLPIRSAFSVQAGNFGGYLSGMNQYSVDSSNQVTNDAMGMTIDNLAYGNTGWAGPGIWVDDPSFSYPVMIGFQNKATWTDGTITMLKPVDFSGSLRTTAGANLSGPIVVDGASQLFVDGLFQANGQTQLNNGAQVTGSVDISGSLTVALSSNINNQLTVTTPSDGNTSLQLQSFAGNSGSISVFHNNFGGQSQPTVFFSGDNSYFQADGNFTIENSPGGQGTGSLNLTTNGFIGIQTNGTGSENVSIGASTGNINLNSNTVNVQNTLNAVKINVSGVPGTDVTITGSLLASSNIAAGAFGGRLTQMNAFSIDAGNQATNDAMGMSIDNAAYGNTGWAGPGIWVDDPAFNYPVLIGFQNKATWTDGTITMLKPVDISGSLRTTTDATIGGPLVATTGITTNKLTVTGVPGTDATITGSLLVTSGMSAGTFGGRISQVNQFSIDSANQATNDAMGMTIDNAAYGNTGWAGPGIWVDDPAFNYPVMIGFQNKATWTDGRITMLKNTDVSGSLNITEKANLAPQDPLPSGVLGDMAVSSSAELYFHNGTTWNLVV